MDTGVRMLKISYYPSDDILLLNNGCPWAWVLMWLMVSSSMPMPS